MFKSNSVWSGWCYGATLAVIIAFGWFHEYNYPNAEAIFWIVIGLGTMAVVLAGAVWYEMRQRAMRWTMDKKPEGFWLRPFAVGSIALAVSAGQSTSTYLFFASAIAGIVVADFSLNRCRGRSLGESFVPLMAGGLIWIYLHGGGIYQEDLWTVHPLQSILASSLLISAASWASICYRVWTSPSFGSSRDTVTIVLVEDPDAPDFPNQLLS